jgi:hypothetical protein
MMTWLQPLAWWGLLAVLVPVLIHLLARQRSRRLPFPSLRFLRATQMTALRTRVVSHWPLLLVRMSIVGVATAALAGPVLVSDARRASWDARVARAIVVSPPGADSTARLAEEEARGSFTSAEFRADHVADGIRAAVDWLGQQPPAAREVVIVGDFREGTIVDADLLDIPASAGVRFLPVPADSPGETLDVSGVAEGPDGRFGVHTQQIILDGSRTRVRRGASEPVGDLPQIVVVASKGDQRQADAVLRAVLREGVWRPIGDRRITIAFNGSPMAAAGEVPSASWMRRTLEQNPQVRGGERDGVLVVRPDMPATDPAAAAVVASVLRSAFEMTFDEAEPRRIAASTLARWSRPAAASPAGARPGDERDRRWFWLAVIGLLGVEHLLRRGKPIARHERVPARTEDEARVA